MRFERRFVPTTDAFALAAELTRILSTSSRWYAPSTGRHEGPPDVPIVTVSSDPGALASSLPRRRIKRHAGWDHGHGTQRQAARDSHPAPDRATHCNARQSANPSRPRCGVTRGGAAAIGVQLLPSSSTRRSDHASSPQPSTTPPPSAMSTPLHLPPASRGSCRRVMVDRSAAEELDAWPARHPPCCVT